MAAVSWGDDGAVSQADLSRVRTPHISLLLSTAACSVTWRFLLVWFGVPGCVSWSGSSDS